MKPSSLTPTVHKDITERLRKINPQLAEKSNTILQENKKERHIRGGIATREKYRIRNVAQRNIV